MVCAFGNGTPANAYLPLLHPSPALSLSPRLTFHPPTPQQQVVHFDGSVTGQNTGWWIEDIDPTQPKQSALQQQQQQLSGQQLSGQQAAQQQWSAGAASAGSSSR